jgi:hypothetical protein
MSIRGMATGVATANLESRFCAGHRAAWFLAFALSAATACSDQDGGSTLNSGGAGNRTGGNSGTNGSGGSVTATSGGTTGSTGSSGGIAPEFEACASESREAESVPLDIFMMVDQSVSMVQHEVSPGVTRWAALKQALIEFIEAPESAGLRVGVQYFGIGVLSDAGFCSALTYATPEVEIALLPGNETTLVGSIESKQPGNQTPTYPALQGALMHATEWASTHPERPTIVLLATDGYPTECDPSPGVGPNVSTIPEIAALAGSYANPAPGQPRIPTFVLGLGAVPNLDAIAEAGEGEAFFVADEPGAVTELGSALRRVTNSPAVCQFELPEPPSGLTLDPDLVNVQYRPPGGSAQVIPNVENASVCDTLGGWYYDNNEDPSMIFVCQEVCSMFGGAIVDVVLGCETIVEVR